MKTTTKMIEDAILKQVNARADRRDLYGIDGEFDTEIYGLPYFVRYDANLLNRRITFCLYGGDNNPIDYEFMASASFNVEFNRTFGVYIRTGNA